MFNRKLLVAALLFIITPVGVSVLMFGGFFRGSIFPVAVITGSTAKLEFERPVGDIDLGKWIMNTYSDGKLFIALNVYIHEYDEDHWGYGGADCVLSHINVSANLMDGFVVSANVVFEEDHAGSYVDFYELRHAYVWRNLSLHSHADWILQAGVKAHLNFSASQSPKNIFLSGPFSWTLNSPHNQTHRLSIKLEFTYNNGTDYLMVVLPMELVVWAEAGNSFETAREIDEGEHIGYSWVVYDPEDYYKVWVETGEDIWLRVEPLRFPPAFQDFEVYLHNPDLRLVANATEEEVDYTPEELSFTADMSGYWYIRIVKVRAGGGGLYKLTVTIKSVEP